jgi:hypothetical protein
LSSPISLWKIFVALTKSASALVLKTSMRVCTFGIFMEQRAVIRFFILKGLRACAIAAELKSVHETEAPVFSTMKKWRKRFAEGRTSLYDDPRCRRSLTNDFSGAISAMLKERPCLSCKILCQHFHIAKATCLRILRDTIAMKSSIFVGFPMP